MNNKFTTQLVERQNFAVSPEQQTEVLISGGVSTNSTVCVFEGEDDLYLRWKGGGETSPHSPLPFPHEKCI